MNSPNEGPGKSELDYAPPWAREQAARDQAAHAQPARDQTARDHAARDQVRATLRQSGGAAAEPRRQSNPESRTLAEDRPWHQRALEPELVPEPPAGISNLWPMMLRMGLVCGIAAIVAGAVVFVFSPKPVHKVAQANVSDPAIVADDAAPPPIDTAGVPALAIEASTAPTVAPLAVAQGPIAIAKPQMPQAPAITASPATTEAPVAATAPAQQIASLTSPTVSSANIKSAPAARPVDSNPAATDPKPAASPTASPAPVQAAPPAPQSAPRPTIVLDETEIDTLIKRGKNLLNDGDFAAARVPFERAANAGSAEAALALGSTYDPNVIKRLGAIMVKPDIESARKWYQLAADRGSAAANLQLANLPQNR